MVLTINIFEKVLKAGMMRINSPPLKLRLNIPLSKLREGIFHRRWNGGELIRQKFENPQNTANQFTAPKKFLWGKFSVLMLLTG